MRKSIALRPIPSLLLAMLSVQLGAALAKSLFAVAGPLGTGAVRIGFSALLLLVGFRPRLAALGREQWRAVIPYGMVLGVMNLLFYCALARIPLGLAVAIEFTGPLLVALLGSRRVLDVLWAVLAIAGILLVTPWSTRQPVDPTGIAMALGAGALWAAYILLGRRVSQVVGAATGVATGMMVAALTAVPILFFSSVSLRFPPRFLWSGAAIALLSSALPYTLEMMALGAMPARTFGILMSLEPALAAGCGWLWLGEKLSPLQCLAITLIIIASAGTSRTSRAAQQPV